VISFRDHVEVITSVQRRRRWSAEEKAAMVQETYAPGMSVSLVARQHGIAPNQLFRWRRLLRRGRAVSAGEAVVAAAALFKVIGGPAYRRPDDDQGDLQHPARLHDG
jgi:transposase-like protein